MQCSAQDERARKLPMSEEVIGDLMRYVTAHEVGHTLGLRHNHRGSSAYTIEQLRDPAFTATHGTVASIMAYGRYNYVAQPEDKVKRLIPLVGPYDMFAIEWGYKAIPGAKTPADEKPALDKLAARQIDEPWLRFGGEDAAAGVDPSVKTENIGSDSVKATELGLKNLDRVLDYLVAATTEKGEDFSLLQEAYGAIMAHRRNWFGAVALNVGGVVENRTLGGRGTESFTRVSKEKQKEAVEFLVKYDFSTPKKLLDPAIVNRFKFTAVGGDVMSQQTSMLRSLLSSARIHRLMDSEVLMGDKAYTAADLVEDLQKGIWSELSEPKVKVDPLRRNLQRTYLEILKAEIAPTKGDTPAAPSPFGPGAAAAADSVGSSDFKAIALEELKALKAQILASKFEESAADAITKIHLRESLREIDQLLGEKK